MLRARRHNQANALSFYKSPPDWFSEPQADFQVAKRFFQSLRKKDVWGALIYLFSMLFNIIFAWKPDASFGQRAKHQTAPARALHWHRQLRLTAADMHRLEGMFKDQVFYGAMQAAEQANAAAKKSGAGRTEASAASSAAGFSEPSEARPKQTPESKWLPKLQLSFQCMRFLFECGRWSLPLNEEWPDEMYHSWCIYIEDFRCTHAWFGWKKPKFRSVAWEHFKAFYKDVKIETKPDRSPAELEELEKKLAASLEEEIIEAAAPSEVAEAAKEDVHDEEVHDEDFEAKAAEGAMAVGLLLDAMEKGWLMSAPSSHQTDVAQILDLCRQWLQKGSALGDLQDMMMPAQIRQLPTSMRAWTLVTFTGMQFVESENWLPTYIQIPSDTGIRKWAGQCTYDDPGNICLDFTYHILMLHRFSQPHKLQQAMSATYRRYGSTSEKSGSGRMNFRGNIIEALLHRAQVERSKVRPGRR